MQPCIRTAERPFTFCTAHGSTRVHPRTCRRGVAVCLTVKSSSVCSVVFCCKNLGYSVSGLILTYRCLVLFPEWTDVTWQCERHSLLAAGSAGATTTNPATGALLCLRFCAGFCCLLRARGM